MRKPSGKALGQNDNVGDTSFGGYFGKPQYDGGAVVLPRALSLARNDDEAGINAVKLFCKKAKKLKL